MVGRGLWFGLGFAVGFGLVDLGVEALEFGLEWPEG